MLTITQALHDQIVAHARADHPDEACGVVAGPAYSGRAERFIPMLNAARSPTFYEFDSADLLKLYREMDDRDEEPVIVYHSHTATEAYPSRTDITYANELLPPTTSWSRPPTRTTRAPSSSARTASSTARSPKRTWRSSDRPESGTVHLANAIHPPCEIPCPSADRESIR